MRHSEASAKLDTLNRHLVRNMERNKEMQSFAARLNTFQIAHQLSKRRASSQASSKKKGAGNTVEWPHERPSGEEVSIHLYQSIFGL